MQPCNDPIVRSLEDDPFPAAVASELQTLASQLEPERTGYIQRAPAPIARDERLIAMRPQKVGGTTLEMLLLSEDISFASKKSYLTPRTEKCQRQRLRPHNDTLLLRETKCQPYEKPAAGLRRKPATN